MKARRRVNRQFRKQTTRIERHYGIVTKKTEKNGIDVNVTFFLLAFSSPNGSIWHTSRFLYYNYNTSWHNIHTLSHETIYVQAPIAWRKLLLLLPSALLLMVRHVLLLPSLLLELNVLNMERTRRWNSRLTMPFRRWLGEPQAGVDVFWILFVPSSLSAMCFIVSLVVVRTAVTLPSRGRSSLDETSERMVGTVSVKEETGTTFWAKEGKGRSMATGNGKSE